MYSIKQALISKEHEGADLDTAIFFMDMRTHGKGFDEYYDRAKNEKGVRFIRSRIHTIDAAGPESDDLSLTYVDESGRMERETFDMAVLSVGLEISSGARELALKLGIDLTPEGFVKTGCLNPVETSRKGVFVCGSLANPVDIPQSVTDALAASAASAALLSDSRNSLIQEKVYPSELPVGEEEPRIGVFVCHCGINIGSVVDVPAVRDYAKGLPFVVHAEDNMFSCSEDTQHAIREAIKEHALTRVAIAACTPRTHEPLFQETIREAGLNPFLLEFANIRDQDAWVHQGEPEEATSKAMDLVRMAVSKAALSEPVGQLRLEVNSSALVIGGGVSGMKAALNLAGQGLKTYLVEQDSELGGHARHLRQTWKGEDVQDYLKGLKEQVLEHSRIEVLLDTRIENVSGFVGNFETTVRTGETTRELSHGAAVIATGADYSRPEEYGYGKNERVTCWHELEDRFEKEPGLLASAKAVAFIQCVGSREPDRPYCSKVCCTASMQSAIALKTVRPELEVYVFYRDMRTYGHREDLYRRARELGVVFFRYSADQKPLVSESEGAGEGKLVISFTDKVLERPMKVEVDYLNLYSSIVPNDNQGLAHLFKVPLGTQGFFHEAHVKLRPVDFSTDGVFVCGMAHYPKPLEESIAQAQAAASRAAGILVKDYVEMDPIVSMVDREKCIGCGFCEASCPFNAIRLIKVEGKGYRAENIPALCKGCGICAAGCPQRAIDMVHFRDQQIITAIAAGGESARAAKAALESERVAGPASVSGYRIADDYYYHSGHTWALPGKGGRMKIGLDDFAGKILGPTQGIKLPAIGAMLRQDLKAWMMVRDGNRAACLSPLTGKVFAINRKALEHPDMVAEDPYGEGWLLIVEPVVPKLELKHLRSGRDSVQWVEQEWKSVMELFGEDYERLAATGGRPIVDLFGHFPEVGWDKLVKAVLKTTV